MSFKFNNSIGNLWAKYSKMSFFVKFLQKFEWIGIYFPLRRELSGHEVEPGNLGSNHVHYEDNSSDTSKMHTRKRYRSKINDTFSVNFIRIDSQLPAFILNHTIRNVCEQECIQFSTWRCKKNDNSYTIKLNESMEKKSNLANFSNKPKPDFPSFRWTSNWFPCKCNVSNWPNDETTRVWEMIWKVYFTSGWRTILTLFFNRYYSEGVCE